MATAKILEIGSASQVAGVIDGDAPILGSAVSSRPVIASDALYGALASIEQIELTLASRRSSELTVTDRDRLVGHAMAARALIVALLEARAE
jgi:hypothetical protein